MKQSESEAAFVSNSMQLPDFPEVFAGGDCVSMKDSSLPPTAQVAYQQGQAIAHNLKALALGNDLKPASINLRGTLLKQAIAPNPVKQRSIIIRLSLLVSR
ncbi:MAG: hypothetical protein DSM106950_35715 [Stigonema ocellatum SAG 48.90 = DSM 106950]|nr:hypothetical protein [Stigonema ocellatum SAG 48.90 = DSM 106950]